MRENINEEIETMLFSQVYYLNCLVARCSLFTLQDYYTCQVFLICLVELSGPVSPP